MTSPGAGTVEVLVRFVTHPHSVRTARQLVGDTLRAWDLEPLVDDARLVVTELATNATLHSGARSFRVSVAPALPAGVRIAVGDEGAVPAAAVVPRGRLGAGGPGMPLRATTTTGRGLAIVEELAASWGVTVDGSTKWIWAQLLPNATAQEQTSPAPPAAAVTDPGGTALPPGWHVVQLVRCPVLLSLAQDDHLDELVRELQLIGPRTDRPELASVIAGLLAGQAQARHTGRRTAQDAAAQGREHVTVELLLPSVAADQVEHLHDAVAAADALCEQEQLLTLASRPEVRRLRDWLRDQIRDQIRDGRPPVPYDDWLASAPPR